MVYTPIYPEAMASPAKTNVYIATNRGTNEAGFFDRTRGDSSVYLRATISLPSDRKPGEAPQLSNKPDFEQHYVLADQHNFDTVDAFSREIRDIAHKRPAAQDEVVIFVHGFYNTHANALFRSAQIKQDFAIPGPLVTFSWPSAGRALAYNYDNESVLYARDDLETLLLSLGKHGPDQITLIGHSRGSLLITETLRQIEIQKPGWSHRHLDSVLLIAPDMPVEVFHRSVARYQSLPQPFFLMTTSEDRALRLSSRINGTDLRLGQITDPAQLGGLPVSLIDVSNFALSDSNNHNLFAESPALISLLRDQKSAESLIDSLETPGLNTLTKTVQVIGDTMAIELFPTDDPGPL
ncbi:alpha/beta hydrolase [Shimia sp. SK013]|uniref:alpha/beta hydrolase n=1 Tax=Shimia sp. SK013 TaxID=1389006 RepID=UPI00187C8887|nr:alpha/beta fold hydrolase [Shimia sp. SK013]